MNTANTPCQARRILIPSPTFGVHSTTQAVLPEGHRPLPLVPRRPRRRRARPEHATANASAGAPQPRHSTITYTCCKQVVLRRPVESADRPGIGVMRESGEAGGAFAPPSPERHLEAVQHQRGRHARRGPPAEDATGVRVEHERDVHPPRPRPHVGEVRDPELVRAEPGEVPVDEIRWAGLPWIRVELGASASHGARR